METYNINLSEKELNSLLSIINGFIVDRSRFIDQLIPSIDDRRIAVEEYKQNEASELWTKLYDIAVRK